MKMTNKLNEKLVDFAKRVMNQATIMGRIVEANFQDAKTLIYPQDDFNGVLRAMKIHDLQQKIAQLS